MRSIVKYIAIPAVVLAAACQSKDDSKLDDALSKDLALASQVQPYQPQQFVSPQEMGYMNGINNGNDQIYFRVIIVGDQDVPKEDVHPFLHIEGPNGTYLVQCMAPSQTWHLYSPLFNSMLARLQFLQ